MDLVAPFRYEFAVLHLIDQTALPQHETWLELRAPDEVAEAIASLRVRGAPAIGVAAAYGMCVAADNSPDDPLRALEDAAPRIGDARPTAVNLARAVERVLRAARSAGDASGAAREEARAIHDFEVHACLEMGRLGADLLGADVRALTYCNTGALATGGIGTAFGVLRTAHDRGLLRMAWVPETRPLLQGARLTAWEAGRLRMPYTLIADAAAGSLFARGLVDVVVVGADRIARNGDTANKIGTFTLAVLARAHDVPFYVVAPSSSVDANVAAGGAIPIEERDPDEVRGVAGRPVAPADAPAANPAFDVTPANLISAIVTESAVHFPPYAFS